MPELILLGIGAAFVLLGRWLYRNPTKLIPRWGLFNREHPKVQTVARAYAIFIVFFGSLTVISTVILQLLPHGPTPILSLGIAIGATWFLRPRFVPEITEEPDSRVVLDSGKAAERQHLLGRRWKGYLAVLLGVMIVAVCFAFEMIRNSDVSKNAFAMANTNAIVLQRLGEPLNRGFFTSGTIEISGPSGHADIAIPISGPKGKRTIYAVARKSTGHWQFVTLEVAFSGDDRRLDLLKQETNSLGPSKNE